MRRWCALWCFLAALAPAAARSHAAIPTTGGTGLPLFFAPVTGGYAVRVPGLRAIFEAGGIYIATQSATVTQRFPGSNAHVRLEGGVKTEARIHFLGNGPDRINLPGYSSLIYRGLYAGIDMIWRVSGGQLKSEFVVAPGADPGLVRVAYGGATGIEMASGGALLVHTAGGDLREEAPEIYQEIAGKRTSVQGRYRIIGPDTAGFELGGYDAAWPLVIDPTISYSSYLGGTRFDSATAVATDSAGAIYLTGWTESGDFPVTSAAQRFPGGGVDVFVAKLDRTGTVLQYCTYLGGSGDDRGFGIAVDRAGNAYVTGWTQSANFPAVAPVQNRLSGVRDAFVAKLNSAGNRLLYSTFLGGSGSDEGHAIALDDTGAVYIAGETASSNFPTLRPIRSVAGGKRDGFVAILDSAGRYSFVTYFGGSENDSVAALVLDRAGNIYIAGATDSPDFPISAALQPRSGGGHDAFVAKLLPGGSSLAYSTYLGGSGGSPVFPESAAALDVNAAGELFIAGTTNSPDFPVRGTSYAPVGNTGVNAFLVRLNSSGTTILFSTLLGGSSADAATAVRIAEDGSACVAGYSLSPDFPQVKPLQSVPGGDYDAFISCFGAADNALTFSTLLGGAGADSAAAVAIDGTGALVIAGQTQSVNFPLVTPVQNQNVGAFGAFLTKIPLSHRPVFTSLTPTSGNGISQIFQLQVSDAAGYQDLTSVQMLINGGWSDFQACHVFYSAVNNTFLLLNDDATAYLGPLAAGAPGTLQNLQCQLDTAASSATGSGVALTLRVALSFRSMFAGNRNVFVEANDRSGLDAGWQWRGSWTVPGAAHYPAILSWTSNSATGASQTFQLRVSDAAGFADVIAAEILVNSSFSDTNACHIVYYNHALLLLDDRAGAYLGPLAPGSAGSLRNNQCTIAGSGFSTSGSGPIFTLNVAVSLAASFAGTKNIYVQAYDRSGFEAGWQYRGAWTLLGQHPPSITFASPSSGAGPDTTFTLQISDPAGADDIATVQGLINGTFSDSHGCHFAYVAPFNALALVNDAGTTYSDGVVLGAATTLQNSQCRLDVQHTSASRQGNILTLKVPVSFTASFAGGKNIYAEAHDSTGMDAGWRWIGSWSVPGSHAPSIEAVSPSSGAGKSLVLTTKVSDSAGASDIVATQVIINGSSSDYSSCHLVHLSGAANTVYLLNDNGTAYLGPLSPGATGTLQNSQCHLDGQNTTSSVADGSLTLQFGLTFSGSFAGAKNIYVEAYDKSGLSSGWQQRSVWTVPGP